MAIDFFLCLSFFMGHLISIQVKLKHDNGSFACCFYLEFGHENAEPNVRRVYEPG